MIFYAPPKILNLQFKFTAFLLEHDKIIVILLQDPAF